MFQTIGVPQSPLIPSSLYDLPFTSWYLVYGAFMLFFNTFTSIWNVICARRERKEDPITPLFGLLPFVVGAVLATAYLHLQSHVLENHLISFVLFLGLINSYSVGQMITAHLVQAKFPYKNILLLPLALGVGDSLALRFGLWPSVLGGGANQIVFVYVCLGFALGVYGSFVVSDSVVIVPYCNSWTGG